MEAPLIIGALGTAITGMAGFIVWLFKTVVADKDKQIERLIAANLVEGKTAEESLQMTRQSIDLLKSQADVLRKLTEAQARMERELSKRIGIQEQRK